MALRDYILNNFWVKLFSLLLAIMIWCTVNYWQEGGRLGRARVSPTREITISRLPITVLKPADDERSYHVTPATVDVILSGPAAKLSSFSSRDLEVFVNLTDTLNAGRRIKKIHAYCPSGLTVERINPPNAFVEAAEP